MSAQRIVGRELPIEAREKRGAIFAQALRGAVGVVRGECECCHEERGG